MKKNIFGKGIRRRLLNVVLALAVVITLVPANMQTVYAATTEKTVTITNSDIPADVQTTKSFTKDGVTVTAGNINDGGTFTTSSGKFTKIEVTSCSITGDNWTPSEGTSTWTGEPSNSVSFSGSISGGGGFTIVFTIEEHKHEWKYSQASADQIMAKCEEAGHEGDMYLKVYVTAVPPEYRTIYEEGDFCKETGKQITPNDIEIYKVATSSTTTGGTLVSGTPEEVGYYYASLTIEGITIVKAFVVGDPGAVTGVTLDRSSAVLTAGSTEKLTATVIPDTATDKSVMWESSDKNIATVDKDGVVTAVAAGKATITVTTHDGSKKASCDVTVNNAAHTHCFNYSATGTALTAKCGAENCDLPNNQVSVIITAEDAGYTGKSYAGASLAGADAWKKAGLDIPVIEYCGRESTKHDSKIPPKDVGTYTAKITVDGKTASVDFAITEDKPKKQAKTDEERVEEQRQIAAIMAAYNDFFESNPEMWAYVNEQYAINPALGLDSALSIVANATYEQYQTQMAAFFEMYAEQMALYMAMMNAQSVQ